METNFLIELINKAEEFQVSRNHKKGSSLEEFRRWLNEEAYKKDSPTTLFAKNKVEINNLENEICKQTLLLSRFSKQMIRRGLADFPLLSNEDFTYLYRMIDDESLTKMQLVEKNGHEKQTGIEIIKRLLKNGVLEEYQDEHDKRTKRIKATPLGKELFKKSVNAVSATSKVLSAKLSDEEKKQFLSLLKKLNEFHFSVYHDHKASSVEEIESLL